MKGSTPKDAEAFVVTLIISNCGNGSRLCFVPMIASVFVVMFSLRLYPTLVRGSSLYGSAEALLVLCRMFGVINCSVFLCLG